MLCLPKNRLYFKKSIIPPHQTQNWNIVSPSLYSPRHGHTGRAAAIFPQIAKYVFHTQGGRSVSYILIFVFCAQKAKKVEWARPIVLQKPGAFLCKI